MPAVLVEEGCGADAAVPLQQLVGKGIAQQFTRGFLHEDTGIVDSTMAIGAISHGLVEVVHLLHVLAQRQPHGKDCPCGATGPEHFLVEAWAPLLDHRHVDTNI
eukprot:scaffold1446_cov175-Ochromonas_danica.AAC.22